MNSKRYYQFCPVAMAAEIVATRWTPLVIRELLCGSARFNDLRRGVPLMSQSLLSHRLRELQDAGLVKRSVGADGASPTYRLTPAGEALRPIIEMLGVWGDDWVQVKIRTSDLDAGLLMWDIRRNVDATVLPADRRVTVHFQLSHVQRGPRLWWLVFDGGEADLCLKDPGYQVDLHVHASLRALTEVWMGKCALAAAIADRKLRLDGAATQARLFRKWFALSPFATAESQKRLSINAT